MEVTALRSAQKDENLIMSTSIPWPLSHISLVSDSHLDALRMEPKIKASATRQKQKMGHSERQYELVSAACPDRRYRLFVRQSILNQDVFSVGLTLIQPDGDLVLCRYNSGHHGHRNMTPTETKSWYGLVNGSADGGFVIAERQ